MDATVVVLVGGRTSFASSSMQTIDLSNVLAFAPRDTPLAVVAIVDAAVRAACARLGIHEGDRITCNETLAESLFVRSAGGRRMLLSVADALVIEVEPALPS